MVYEKKCSECDKILDFGGEDDDGLPENGMKFNGNIYCRECVKKFVEFGTGEFMDRMGQIEEAVEDIQKELGMEKTLND